MFVLFFACGEPAFEPPNDVPAGDVAPLEVPEVGTASDAHFATGEVCALCHSNHDDADALRDDQDRPIGMFDLWQGTMMANAARDPLWRATLAVEMAEFPTQAGALEQKCARCHMPMAVVDAALHDRENTGLGLLDGTGDGPTFARDGVSCTTCHQITADGLGTPASFTGNYNIDADGAIYGPYMDPALGPMEAHTGFTPTFGLQIRDAGLCGSCHTLYSTPFDDAGNPLGIEFPEQTPYLEWKASGGDAEGGKTCQGCHVPQTDEDGEPIETAIARSPPGGDFNIGAREPYGRHLFVGGNTWIPQLLRDNPDVLHPHAPAAAFDATIAAARDNLTRAATVDASVTRDGGRLVGDVSITNTSGHKFPTGYPARRAWLHVLVTDADGAAVFESGGYDPVGRLIDGQGEVLRSEWRGGPVLPHVDTITDDAQVVVYEPILQGADGAPTFRLYRAVAYAKDTRLLPGGWDAGAPEAAGIGPVGVDGDANFGPGGDTVHVDVKVGHKAPYTVLAEVLYQPVSARWSSELFGVDLPETRALKTMWNGLDKTPERVARVIVEVE